MKKILFIHTIFEGGGAAVVPRNLFSYFNASGEADAYFAYGRGSRSNKPKTFKFGCTFEQALHLFLVRFFGIEGYGTYFSTRRLIKFLKKEQFDVVHIHNLHGYYVDFFTLFTFLKTTNAKVIWTLHDEWALTWLRAHSMGCVHCKTGEGTCTSQYDYPKNYFPIFKKWMLRKKQQNFASLQNLTIVCPAQWLASAVKQSYLHDVTTRVIYNGVDLDLFRPVADKSALRKTYNLPVDKKIVLFSATDLRDEHKGVAHILSVADRFPEHVFLGLGKGDITKANVVTTGFVADRAKVGDIFSLADIYLFASRVETMPLFVTEALAAGLPVIAFDIPALREVIDASVGSLVEPYGDSLAMANAVKQLLADDDRLRAMAAKGRALTEERFSLVQFQEAYRNEYLS